MIFFLLLKSQTFVINFADDNTLYSHGSKLPLILNNLEHDMRNLLYWFKIDPIKTNPGKFQFMILGKKKRLKYSLKIGSITIKESDEVDLIGITIDKALNVKKTYRKFMSHCPVQASCFKTNQKIPDIR